MHNQRFYTLTASCPDRVGIVARVAGFLERIHARPAYKRSLERGGPYAF